MEFIRTICATKSKMSDVGYLVLSPDDRTLTIHINTKKYNFKTVGFVKGGIGVELEPATSVKKWNISTKIKFSEDDSSEIPSNLLASNYKFKIPAKKISDTEFIFEYEAARMKPITK